jgi:hypothetical protein
MRARVSVSADTGPVYLDKHVKLISDGNVCCNTSTAYVNTPPVKPGGTYKQPGNFNWLITFVVGTLYL